MRIFAKDGKLSELQVTKPTTSGPGGTMTFKPAREMQCPDCGHIGLDYETFTTDFFHKGRRRFVSGLESFLCPACGQTPIFADQVERNHKRFDAVRKLFN